MRRTECVASGKAGTLWVGFVESSFPLFLERHTVRPCFLNPA